MNANYEKTLNENFNKALNLCENSYSHSELLDFLKFGNIPEKQYASLMLSHLDSFEDAQVFISNLVNCDGKIREAVAQKLLEFSVKPEYCYYFSKFPEILTKGTIDINANISRMVIEALERLVGYSEFGIAYTKMIINYIQDSFNGLDKIIYKDKKYLINKQLFKLYWCLEVLKSYYIYIDKEILHSLLERALREDEYTIKEKVTQILVRMKNPYYNDLLEIVKNDDNYYVQRIFQSLSD